MLLTDFRKLAYQEAVDALNFWREVYKKKAWEMADMREENNRLRDKCERLDSEVRGLMKAAQMNDGGTCNATGPVMTDEQHTEAYQKYILSMFGNG